MPVPAETTLARFKRAIEWATRQTAGAFGPEVDLDDVAQEARILVLSYAGIMPGRLSGKLANWQAESDGNARRVTGLLATQLRRDLCQIFGRQQDRNESTLSLENLPQELAPSYDFEDAQTSGADEIRSLYPYLSRRFLDGMTEQEISDAEGTPLRTVKYRVAAEKRRALADPHMIRKAGVLALEERAA